MPNHVVTHISTDPEVIDSIVSKNADGKEYLDFNRFIPMPECMQGDIPSHVKTMAEITLGLIDFSFLQQALRTNPMSTENMGHTGNILHTTVASKMLFEGNMAMKLNDTDFDRFLKMLRAYRDHGYCDWYDWSVKHWGTKWNAYSYERLKPTLMQFETAWSAPHPVIIHIAAETKADILYEWADEDIGNNVGTARFKDGVEVEVADLTNTQEGLELALELHGREKEDKYGSYVFTEGRVKYIEKEEV